MSGHSHWHKIKYKKGTADAQKSRAFSKMIRLITVAVKEGGGDLETNPKLRMVVDQAKEINLPSDNIERAIQKGTGELEGVRLEEFLFEAYGPSKIALIIEGITDNKNRALADIKQILNKNNGKLVDTGSVQWLFERKGVITTSVAPERKDEAQMMAIEAGAEDLDFQGNTLLIYTKPQDLDEMKRKLENKGIVIESTSLDWVAKEKVTLKEQEKKMALQLFEALDESEDVQEIYSNLKI